MASRGMPPLTMSCPRLAADDLVQTFDEPIRFFRRNTADLSSEPLDRQRADLADLCPGAFREFHAGHLQGQRKTGPLRWAGPGHRNPCPGTVVRWVFANDACRQPPP